MLRNARPPTSAIASLLIFALATGAGSATRALAPPPPNLEDVTNAAALMGAPWLVCESGPDPVAGIPAGMHWNWSTKQFEPGEKLSGGLILFDDGKRRGKLMKVADAKLSATDNSDLVGNEGEELRPYAVALRNRVYLIVISRRRTGDGGFLGIAQSTGDWRLFSLDPFVEFVPLSCVPSGDDALTRRIERARDEWLMATPTTESPQQ